MPGNDLCNNCERLDVVDVGSFRIIVFRVFFSLSALVGQGMDRLDQGTSWQMSTTHGWRNHSQCEQEHLPPGSVCLEAGFCRCHRLHQPWWEQGCLAETHHSTEALISLVVQTDSQAWIMPQFVASGTISSDHDKMLAGPYLLSLLFVNAMAQSKRGAHFPSPGIPDL